jgi:hypothetical protein
MPGNYPEESIQHSEHGESLKSRSHKIDQPYQVHPQILDIPKQLLVSQNERVPSVYTLTTSDPEGQKKYSA